MTGSTLPLFHRARAFAARTAVVDGETSRSYAELLDASERVASGLLDGSADLQGARVAYLLAPSFEHVATQWGILRAGGVAVPLCVTHPDPELEHVISDSKPTIVMAGDEFYDRVSRLVACGGRRVVSPRELLANRARPLPSLAPDRPALILYTSGTTGKPKGVVTTHAILTAQIESLVAAWEIVADDRIVHVLPLHHLHGVLNALCSVLFAGGTVDFLPRFDAASVFERFARTRPTLFMAVPTIYSKLVQAWEALPTNDQSAVRSSLERFRLVVSGSAALPVSLLERFEAMSGHVLLERYGMTEIGMALGNPLKGERRPGSVGVPFPGVVARIVDEAGNLVPEGSPGELQIRGPNVFLEYFERPEETARAFTREGFFKTGDVAVVEDGRHRLLGRASVDIIKTGGYKVSALEIEEALREHASIAEIAVIGVADPEWGERVAAIVVTKPGTELALDELRAFGKERLAPYKVPSLLWCVETLPRNALGKVQKTELKTAFGPS